MTPVSRATIAVWSIPRNRRLFTDRYGAPTGVQATVGAGTG